MMRFYSAQISVALAHLHAHNIVYRDLKPENILLDQQGNVKLTDFGLSKRLDKMASHNPNSLKGSDLTFCGTPEYLSPEMILHRKGNSGYGREVDWWSLGIVCFELLTGWPPFYDRDFNRMCEKILYRPLVFPTQKYNLTRDAEDLVRSLLQRDPKQRIRYMLTPSTMLSPTHSPIVPIAGGGYHSSSFGTATSGENTHATSSFSSSPSVGYDLEEDINGNNRVATGSTPGSKKDRAISSNSGSATVVTTAGGIGGGNSSNSGFSKGEINLTLQSHPFYEGMDWVKLLECLIEPPFIPPRPREITDTCNFDKEFTKLSVKESTDQYQKPTTANVPGAGDGKGKPEPAEKDVSLFFRCFSFLFMFYFVFLFFSLQRFSKDFHFLCNQSFHKYHVFVFLYL
jgi:serine/threonine protein kinase